MSVPVMVHCAESHESWRKNGFGSTLCVVPRACRNGPEISQFLEMPAMEAKIKLENRAGLDDEALVNLIREVSGQSSIRHVVDWLGRHQPPLKMEDMVTQDEFSHDIMVPYRGGLYLVYDST
jgi:hypothetical protein